MAIHNHRPRTARQIIDDLSPAVSRRTMLAVDITQGDRERLERPTQAAHGIGLPQLAIKALAVKEALAQEDWRAKVGALEDCASLCLQWSRVLREEVGPAAARRR